MKIVLTFILVCVFICAIQVDAFTYKPLPRTYNDPVKEADFDKRLHDMKSLRYNKQVTFTDPKKEEQLKHDIHDLKSLRYNPNAKVAAGIKKLPSLRANAKANKKAGKRGSARKRIAKLVGGFTKGMKIKRVHRSTKKVGKKGKLNLKSLKSLKNKSKKASGRKSGKKGKKSGKKTGKKGGKKNKKGKKNGKKNGRKSRKGRKLVNIDIDGKSISASSKQVCIKNPQPGVVSICVEQIKA